MSEVNIRESILKYQKELAEFDCTLVPVSKTKPDADLMEAYATGNRIFGENKVQEVVEKYERLPKDIKWHFIGHLQRNKVKYLAPFVALVHAVDSQRLLQEINKQAAKNDRVIECLLQVHIAREEAKFGLAEDELIALLESGIWAELPNVKVIGLMGMATNTDNQEQVRMEFKGLKALFDELKTRPLPENVEMQELSMGMSNDYKIALEEGSTMVRIGSAIFGARDYCKNG